MGSTWCRTRRRCSRGCPHTCRWMKSNIGCRRPEKKLSDTHTLTWTREKRAQTAPTRLQHTHHVRIAALILRAILDTRAAARLKATGAARQLRVGAAAVAGNAARIERARRRTAAVLVVQGAMRGSAWMTINIVFPKMDRKLTITRETALAQVARAALRSKAVGADAARISHAVATALAAGGQRRRTGGFLYSSKGTK